MDGLAKTKFYAVKNGRQTGIFLTWSQCQEQVKGYPGAIYKSFSTKEEAIAYLGDQKIQSTTHKVTIANLKTPYAFVDGSYNITTKDYGYGGFIQIDEKTKITLQGKGNDTEKANMRNVAGEIDGAMAAVKSALDHDLTQITILYDYQGIESWATGDWQAKNIFTQQYRDIMQTFMRHIQIHFVKVKGHSGIPGNELADQLAKEAVGIK